MWIHLTLCGDEARICVCLCVGVWVGVPLEGPVNVGCLGHRVIVQMGVCVYGSAYGHVVVIPSYAKHHITSLQVCLHEP